MIRLKVPEHLFLLSDTPKLQQLQELRYLTHCESIARILADNSTLSRSTVREYLEMTGADCQ